MKITEKGQVTIPKVIREHFGLYPGTDVRFVEQDRRVVLEKAQGRDAWEKYRGYARLRIRTDEVMRRLRGPRP